MISEKEAIAQGMNDFDIAYGFMTGDIIPDPDIDHRTPNEKIHGMVVSRRQEAYGDVTVYEDGYEEYYPIGD